MSYNYIYLTAPHSPFLSRSCLRDSGPYITQQPQLSSSDTTVWLAYTLGKWVIQIFSVQDKYVPCAIQPDLKMGQSKSRTLVLSFVQTWQSSLRYELFNEIPFSSNWRRFLHLGEKVRKRYFQCASSYFQGDASTAFFYLKQLLCKQFWSTLL